MKNTAVLLLTGVLCALLIASGCTGTAPAGTATPAATTAAATSAATTAAPVSSPEMTAAAAPPASQAASWAGIWNTTWLETDNTTTIARISLAQNGTDVSGNYTFSYPGEGTYSGHLNATAGKNTLTGMYTESDDDSGFFVFTLADDRDSFDGRWVHAENQSRLANSTLWWNGTRV